MTRGQPSPPTQKAPLKHRGLFCYGGPMTPTQFEQLVAVLDRIATATEQANALALASTQVASDVFEKLLPELGLDSDE
jgi:hypothetical protein